MLILKKTGCMNKVYYPIHFSFYSRIEAYVKSGKRVVIQYNNEHDSRSEKKDMLTAVFRPKDSKAEFVRLQSGLVIRLDQLVSVDDNNGPKDTCGIDRSSNPCGDASDY
jgi:hypothetical protein